MSSLVLFSVLSNRYRVSLFSRWKQRGMYAACMWIVQLLLILSKQDSVFIYVPEYYLETLVIKFPALDTIWNSSLVCVFLYQRVAHHLY